MRTFEAKLTSKGQLTLPAELRHLMGVGPGDRVEFFLRRDGEVVVHPRNKPASAIFRRGAAYARPMAREQYERLLGEAVAARGKPSQRRRKLG